jgi:prepilin-type N-terminal cleavage/methylation domain-containing protein/prepilin-type processing-associated H-X9-DG protein
MQGKKGHTIPIGRERKRVARRNYLAFTLIELLVVITIIAVIAGIVFPVFAQAREKAKQAVCLSNQKQIGLAILMYAQDYDDTIVPYQTMQFATASLDEQVAGCYVSLLDPYLKNRQVWKDPAWTEQKMRDGIVYGCGQPRESTNSVLPVPDDKILAHYGVSFYTKGNRNTQCKRDNPYSAFPGSGWFPIFEAPQAQIWYAMPVTEVQRPAETVIVTDGFIAKGTPGRPNIVGGHAYCSGSRMHLEGGNYIFVDGHAKWMKESIARALAQTSDGCWYRKYQTFDF